mmetsp:Transcript_51557/g.120694  ORF Transcript_51557/g.120694 Transcript_51557/m.120694 type:complete len:207 (-) Transcript_51557:447-1067(-)
MKPMSTISSSSTPGNLDSRAPGSNHLSSHVVEAPTNQITTCLVVGDMQEWPANANCSILHSTEQFSASPQSLPSLALASPCSKARVSTSNAAHCTPLFLRVSSRSLASFACSCLSSSCIAANIFFRFAFCFCFWWVNSLSTSCCICNDAEFPGSTSKRSLRVSKVSSNLCIALWQLAFLYRALTIKFGGKASRLARAFSTDLSAAS